MDEVTARPEEAQAGEQPTQTEQQPAEVEQQPTEAEQQPTQAEQEAAALTKKIKRSERSVKSYQFLLLRILILIVVLWVLFFQIVGITTCPTGDMYPRIDAGDLVLYYRLDKDVKAQDIILIEKATPDSATPEQLVLRVVAVAGDTVEITDDEHLIINGNAMIESNIFYPTPRYEGFVEYPLTLGEGQCFVLADSRNGGKDSRYFGVVEQSEILGTVITVARRNNL